MKTFLITLFLSFGLNLSAQDNLIQDILTTWDKHVEMNSLLLKAVNSEYLKDKSASGGRNVGEHFAHSHNVRMLWMSQIDKEVFKTMDDVIDAQESLDFDYLIKTLEASDKLIRSMLENGLKNNSKFVGMTPIRFMGYLISHESHTRGQIILALKQSGHEMPPQVAYGIWEW